MTGFGAKMRHVHNRCRIIRQHSQAIACDQLLQPLAGFEHGQGAKQPYGVQGVCVIGHIRQIGALFHPVHKVVTNHTGDAPVFIA